MGKPLIELPYLLDFYPLEDSTQTRIHPFFENLRKGDLTTTRCKGCGAVLWQPRVVCPKCNGDEMEWISLPKEGTLFAFTEVRAAAPLGMEKDVPFVVGLVELKGADIKLISRIDGARYEDLSIGDPVKLKVLTLEDGRVFYRFVPSAPAHR